MLHQGWDQIGAGRGRYGEIDRSADFAGAGPDLFFRVFQRAQDGAGTGEQRAPRIGQCDAVTMAVEQGCAEFALKLLDLPAERGLCQAQILGSSAVAAELGNGLEVAECSCIHGYNSYSRYALDGRRAGGHSRGLAAGGAR